MTLLTFRLPEFSGNDCHMQRVIINHPQSTPLIILISVEIMRGTVRWIYTLGLTKEAMHFICVK